jgi:NTE family protein
MTGPHLTGSSSNAQATSEALARLDASARGGGTVIALVRPDHRNLPLLLDQVDRAVALLDLAEARTLATRLGALAARLELVALGVGGGRAAADAIPLRLIRTCAAEFGGADVAWLGRHLARAKLGLALGAGAAKGYAHVAVIRALQRAGYTIDCVAGSSIGSWIGAWLALGMDADAIEGTLRTAFTTDVVEVMFRRGASGQPSGLEVMARLARETTGERAFEHLGTPLVVMAADLESRRSVPIETGPLHEALVLAMTVPGLYPPVEQGPRRLVDAVVLAPVPTEALIAAGADVTVAVNLFGREVLPKWPGDDPSDLPRRPGWAARDGVVEALEVAQIDAAARQTALADVPITPRFGPGTWRHFHLADRYLAAGAEAAETALVHLGSLARPQAMASE